MGRVWAEVACHVPEELVEVVADFLTEFTGQGICIDNRRVDTFSIAEEDTATERTVKAYLAADATLPQQVETIRDFLQRLPFPPSWPPVPVVTLIPEEDWAENWKEHFKPVRIGSRLVVKPSWEPYAATVGDIILEIDPGMAFGTGDHPTTRLCLEELEKSSPLARSGTITTGASVLDVGTGSGILAIAAARLGAERVTAIDIDPEAVAVARENVRLNGVVGTVSVAATPLDKVPGTFAIVVANILAEELVRLAPQLLEKLAPGGILLLSGILGGKEELVQQGFARYPVQLTEIRREDEWSCLAYRRE